MCYISGTEGELQSSNLKSLHMLAIFCWFSVIYSPFGSSRGNILGRRVSYNANLLARQREHAEPVDRYRSNIRVPVFWGFFWFVDVLLLCMYLCVRGGWGGVYVCNRIHKLQGNISTNFFFSYKTLLQVLWRKALRGLLESWISLNQYKNISCQGLCALHMYGNNYRKKTL